MISNLKAFIHGADQIACSNSETENCTLPFKNCTLPIIIVLWFNEKNEKEFVFDRELVSAVLVDDLKIKVIMEADYASVSQSQSVHHSGLNDDVSLFNLLIIWA